MSVVRFETETGMPRGGVRSTYLVRTNGGLDAAAALECKQRLAADERYLRDVC